MAAEMKINEKFMVIYGNLRSPKAKIFVSAVGLYYSCRFVRFVFNREISEYELLFLFVLGRRPLFTLFRLVLIKVFNYDI